MANTVYRRIFDDVSTMTSAEKWIRRDVFDLYSGENTSDVLLWSLFATLLGEWLLAQLLNFLTFEKVSLPCSDVFWKRGKKVKTHKRMHNNHTTKMFKKEQRNLPLL